MSRFVIVGASLAGANAAQTLRKEGFTGQIIMIGSESEPPYERPPLSKGYLLGTQEREKAFVQPLSWYADNNIDLRLGTTVDAIDVDAHTVSANGESIPYDKLLLATGARPRELDVPGVEGPQVRYLRTLANSDALRQDLHLGIHVVIVGAGWIGLETASAARKHGATVTVVEADALPLRKVLGDEAAAIYRDLHIEHGVTFHFGSGVASILDKQVVLADGTTIPADLVVIGVGVLPNVELAQAAGLTIDNGVITDAALRTSAPDVYACGDVASSHHPLLGTHVRVEHWENARKSARAAAQSMLDQDVTYDPVPYFFSDQYDWGMEYAGWIGPDGYDQVVFRGEKPEFIAFWLKDGRVLAGMNVNVWDVQEPIRELIRSGRTVDPAQLSNPDVPLTDLSLPSGGTSGTATGPT